MSFIVGVKTPVSPPDRIIVDKLSQFEVAVVGAMVLKITSKGGGLIPCRYFKDYSDIHLGIYS